MINKYKIIYINDDAFCFDSDSLKILKINGKKSDIPQKLQNIKLEKATLDDELHSSKCSRLVFILTNGCNLNCSYCFYKYDPNRHVGNADVNVLMNRYKEIAQSFPSGISKIQFFGGEPLLRFNLIKELVSRICEYCDINNYSKPTFGITTNGLLLDDDKINFLTENNVYITISIDGKEKNNNCRLDKNGNPTYNKLVKIVSHIHDLYPDFPLAAEMTFTNINIDEFYESGIHDIEVLHNLGFNNIHIAPVASDDDIINPFGSLFNSDKLFHYL